MCLKIVLNHEALGNNPSDSVQFVSTCIDHTMQGQAQTTLKFLVLHVDLCSWQDYNITACNTVNHSLAFSFYSLFSTIII
jgi:hypothetical protein